MAVFDEKGVKEFIKNHEQVPTWVGKARKYSDFLKALVDGEKFQELLITKIEKLESAKREVARRKYAKDIRSLFTRLTNNRSNVFQANGGSVEINISGDEQKEDFIKSLTSLRVENHLSNTCLNTTYRYQIQIQTEWSSWSTLQTRIVKKCTLHTNQ